jgi:hypothetical protein
MMTASAPLHSIARLAFATLPVAALCALAFGATSCASTPDEQRPTNVLAPDFAQFTGNQNQVGVSLFLERRCGSLDCHGQVGRPLRIYSQRGLRLPVAPPAPPNVPGLAATTADELLANYQAVVALEPEELSRVVAAGGEAPERLMLLRKPRASERHKGGAVIVVGDSGDRCLTTWLAGAASATDCQAAAQFP